MKIKKALVIGLSAALLLTACEDSYNDEMHAEIKKAFGTAVKDYDSISYPTNNFGLLTAYQGTKEPNDKDFLCDMWNCIGVDDAAIPTDESRRLSMDGMAGTGEGKPIHLTTTTSNNTAVSFLLPEIYKVLSIGSEFSKDSVKSVELTIGKAWHRTLRRQKFSDYLAKLDSDKLLKKAYSQGSLTLIVGDVVVDSIKATVKLDDKTSASIDAKLGAAGNGSLIQNVFKDAKLDVRVSKNSSGVYTFESTKPVIVMRLAKHQTGAGVLAKKDDWSDWKTVELPDPTVTEHIQ
jgi:hypothetical protein